MQHLELLAPAKNKESGMAAICHGADAVYIGADRFGARAAAGNSVEDIEELCEYAHLFGARVYVTVNTIIFEEELEDTRRLIAQLSDIGVDAILVQDMAVLQMIDELKRQGSRVPMVHASTQCDIRTPEKLLWYRALGITRAVLARELSLSEISAMHEAIPDMELEVFVHGALCVSYSGVCYASQYLFDRSANRGECAQFCRMKFDLIDSSGEEIEHERHLLSLKDMCQIDNLEELAACGATSFKIEGRLKDIGYVKNVVSSYSQRLDKLIRKHPDRYQRASTGVVRHLFDPNLNKTFNRGYTGYFINGRQPDIASFDTPKAIGEYVGKVKEMRHDSFNVAGTASFSNGDGLCFFNAKRELVGFRVNRVVGNRIFPFKMPGELKPNTALYRNNDEAFGKILSGKTAERVLPIEMILTKEPQGFGLSLIFRQHGTDEEVRAVSFIEFEHREAEKPQEENIKTQLLKLGGTIFECSQITLADGVGQLFIPSSLLSRLRREAVDAMMHKVRSFFSQRLSTPSAPQPSADTTVKHWQKEYSRYSYLFNVSNHLASDFYKAHGLTYPGKALESERRTNDAILMQCRHCIRYSLGYCVVNGGKKPTWQEPLFLRLGDGRKFRLEFNCNVCQMNVYSEK